MSNSYWLIVFVIVALAVIAGVWLIVVLDKEIK